ncbi:hypothetical protein G5I_00888 [Acromyrmex echinatior]|uniref:Uncharacterized protein n=1 Tax=Acromyrmex echinatior TaxID=103372 RepID=F4W6Q5_ACREC|nr:hypothetical protein G5I_00888 [Acromyrmex echinatior]
MMSMQSSDVMECETSTSEASGNVSSADTSTWSTYLLGRIARRNYHRSDDNGGGSDGGVGGDGAPGRRYTEKGEEKEEVVNVEKPRRNLKHRCIDSNRQLSYSTGADLRGMSRLIAGRDVKGETPRRAVPWTVPRRRWCARATVEESRVQKELRAREEEHRSATSEQERARSSESNAPAGRPRALPAHKTHVDTRIFEVDEEGTAPREDGRRGNSLIYLLIYPSESTSCTWCSVRCDGSQQEFSEVYADSASAIVLLLQHNELLVRAAATSDIANRTFESEEDAMGNPDKERLSGFKHATHVRMILRSQAKNRVCEDLYVRIGTRGADRDAPEPAEDAKNSISFEIHTSKDTVENVYETFLQSRSRERSTSKRLRGSAEETAQKRLQAVRRNEIRRARGTLYKLRLTTGPRIIILGRYSTTMKYETWVAEIFHEVLLSIKQQGNSIRARPLHPRDAPFSKGPPYPYPLSLRSTVLSPTCVPDDREHRGAAQYAALWLNGNAFSCTTDAIGFSRLSAGSTTSLMQPVLRRHWRAATVSLPIYEANTPGRLY